MSQVNNETSIAETLRLQNWAEMIRECNARPSGMKIEDWCKQYGITKHCYYYRFRRVRGQYLKSQKVADSDFALIATGENPIAARLSASSSANTSAFTPKLTIQVNNALISIDENTPTDLLTKVMEVVKHA